MDIILKRILSLIPQDESGKFEHGAKKIFAEKIGYKDGAIVSMWINGSSESYKSKLADIALQYDVSVDWLLGKTDIKKAPAVVETTEEVSPLRQTAIELLNQLDEAQLANFVGLFSSFRKQK